MKIQFTDLKKDWVAFEAPFMAKIKSFGKKGAYVLSEETSAFEKDFAKYCGYKHCVTVSTGLSALEISLRALGIDEGDEVITVSNSAVATSLAISNVGAKPVFCDIGDDFLIDTNQIESLFTKKTKCILPVHLFGKICDMSTIEEIAKRHSIQVLEDACQAHGSGFAGSSRKFTKAFSFYPTKNLGAIGEGGAIVTNDDKVAQFAASYRNYGQRGRYNHIIKGVNARMDSLKCALLRIKLKKLDTFITKRKNIAKRYIDALSAIKQIEVGRFDTTSSYHLFVIRITNGSRAGLIEYLKNAGIDALIHYPTLIHKQPCYVEEYSRIKLPKSESFQDEIVSLPCNPFLNKKEQDHIIKAIIKYFQ